MEATTTTFTTAEPHKIEIGEVCAAMLIAGARALGIEPEFQMSVEAQQKIMFAAAHLVEGLRIVVSSQMRVPDELGN
jgi:hypothetical protein